MTSKARHAGDVPEIPLRDLSREHAELSGELRDAFERTLEKRALGVDDEVPEFEREFADYCGVRHVIGVSAGTMALSLGMAASGIGPGDGVIVPSCAPLSSALSILHAGATPQFCDVEPETGLIDPASVAEVASDNSAAILAVHLHGQMCEMAEIRALADRLGLILLEDAGEAAGATFDGARAGSFGEVAAFSFHPSSSFGALGNGGAVCTDDPGIARLVRKLCALGDGHAGGPPGIGFEARLDGLQAAILRIKLRRLDDKNEARRAWADLYRSVLPAQAECLRVTSQSRCVYSHFPIRVSDRDQVRDKLRQAEIAVEVQYDPPLHRHPALRGYRFLEVGLGASEAWSREELSLPMFAELSVEEVTRVARALEDLLT